MQQSSSPMSIPSSRALVDITARIFLVIILNSISLLSSGVYPERYGLTFSIRSSLLLFLRISLTLRVKISVSFLLSTKAIVDTSFSTRSAINSAISDDLNCLNIFISLSGEPAPFSEISKTSSPISFEAKPVGLWIVAEFIIKTGFLDL